MELTRIGWLGLVVVTACSTGETSGSEQRVPDRLEFVLPVDPIMSFPVTEEHPAKEPAPGSIEASSAASTTGMSELPAAPPMPPVPGLIEPMATVAAPSQPIKPEQACVQTRSESQLNEIALQLILDTSGSMQIRPDGVNSRLKITGEAILRAVETLPPWVHVGLVQFPADSMRLARCEAGAVSSPLGRLGEAVSGQRDQLEASVLSLAPNGGTPTVEAYNQAVAQLADYAAERIPSGANRVATLITDGVPAVTRGACPVAPDGTPADALVELATRARERGITTFVLGVPGSAKAQVELSQMAQAGGTGQPGCSSAGPNYCHIDMTRDDDFATALERALASVTRKLISCTYDIPERSADGERVDRDRINVEWQDASGSTQQLLRNDAVGCDEGWFFTGNTLQLCSTSCQRVQSTNAATLDLLFGCETRVTPSVR